MHLSLSSVMRGELRSPWDDSASALTWRALNSKVIFFLSNQWRSLTDFKWRCFNLKTHIILYHIPHPIESKPPPAIDTDANSVLMGRSTSALYTCHILLTKLRSRAICALSMRPNQSIFLIQYGFYIWKFAFAHFNKRHDFLNSKTWKWKNDFRARTLILTSCR